MLEAAHRLAEEYDTLWYTHLAYAPNDVTRVIDTFGARSVELLDQWGVLSDRLVSVHATYLDDNEGRVARRQRRSGLLQLRCEPVVRGRHSRCAEAAGGGDQSRDRHGTPAAATTH